MFKAMTIVILTAYLLMTGPANVTAKTSDIQQLHEMASELTTLAKQLK